MTLATLDSSLAGTLALAGAGEYLPSMEPVDRALMARLGEPARVVCLPTGAGTEGEARLRYWMDLGEKHFKALGAGSVEALPVAGRAQAMDETLAERVRAANFVYFSGGKPLYLYESLAGTPVWHAVEQVLRRGGVVAGCSAGAMIFGERVLSGPGFQATFAGFGYLAGAFVVPHFDEIPGAIVEAASLLVRGKTMIGIDGGTVLAINREGSAVLGSGRVVVRSGGRREVLRAA